MRKPLTIIFRTVPVPCDGYVQAYNAQAVVDTESMLVVGQRVSDAPNDKRELDKDLASVPEVIENPDAVLTDSGFYSEEPVFGIIKEAMGFRRFSMRGRKKAEIEWCLVCLGYNIKRLFNLQGGSAPIWRPRAVAG